MNTAWKTAWANLTKRQKMIAVCLLLYYIAMIGVLIATAPYHVAIPNDKAVPGEIN